METGCPPWREDRSDPFHTGRVVVRLEQLRAAIVGGREAEFAERATETLCRWHRAVFSESVPLPGYAGGLRGDGAEPCLARNVRAGGGPGVPWREVPAEMAALDALVRALLAEADGLAAYVPPQARDERVLETAARIAAEIVRIHPFLDGNGRMSRLATVWVLHRYGFSTGVLRLEPAPEPPYGRAAAAAMAGDHLPMHEYLMGSVGVYPAARLEAAP